MLSITISLIVILSGAVLVMQTASGFARGSGPTAGNDSYYEESGGVGYGQDQTLRNVSLAPLSVGASPDSSSLHWYFGGYTSSGFSTEVPTLFYNITTPDSFTVSDMLFAGLSTYDTTSTPDYDQMGVVAGSGWSSTQTSSAPCNNTNEWCAYFSMCIYGTGCASGGGTFIDWELGPISSNTQYEEEMNWVTHGGRSPFLTLEFELYSDGTLLDQVSNTGYTFPIGTEFLVQQYAESGTEFCFTDYEEVYALNSIESFPSFNFHTNIGGVGSAVPMYSAYYGTDPPGDNAGPGMISTSYSESLNYVTIQNEPWEAWVWEPFGSGIVDWTQIGSEGTDFEVAAGIGPYADPYDGYSLSYYYTYCTLPCSDVTFSPGSSPVLAWNSCPLPQECSNADIYVSGTIPAGPSTYVIGVYALGVYHGVDYYTISQFEINFPS